MQVIPIDLYETLEELDPKTKTAFIKLVKFLGEIVKREDFLELKAEIEKLTKSVNDLAEAQKKTEERLNQLAIRVDQLAEAQKKTEERLNQLAIRVDQLAEAQKKTEERLNQLAIRVDQLAEAQKKTEERLNQLAIRVDQLAEAQKKTEERLNCLIKEHKITREQLGGLSHAIGYSLEDRAYKALPRLLKENFGVEIEGRLVRKFVEISPQHYEEVNILGRAKIRDKKIVILGEAKTQLKKSDIDAFLKKVERLKKIFPEEKLLLCVTYQTSPQVEEYAKEKGIKIYFSYDFD